MEKRDFVWKCGTKEPHQARRNDILKRYPEIKSLFGPDPNSKWICLILVSLQVYISTVLPYYNLWIYGTVVYTVGATITQALFLAVHESSHNLMFKGAGANRWFSLFLNLPIVIPFSIAFRHYHLDHHKYQGVDGLDTDLPTDLELSVVNNKVSKLIWMVFQIVMYAVRPVIHGKNKLKPSAMLLCNVTVQLLFDGIIYRIWGAGPLLYLILSVLVAGGLHPCAGHFLSEHYVFNPSHSQETFSYYGRLNVLTWNVGYHNEHHDFPYVPGSRLPVVYKIANEYYEPLIQCDSWIHVIYRYVTTPAIGPHSRVKRKNN